MKRILIIIGKLYIGGAERVGRDIGFFADPEKYEIHYLVFGDDQGAYEPELLEKTGGRPLSHKARRSAQCAHGPIDETATSQKEIPAGPPTRPRPSP